MLLTTETSEQNLPYFVCSFICSILRTECSKQMARRFFFHSLVVYFSDYMDTVSNFDEYSILLITDISEKMLSSFIFADNNERLPNIQPVFITVDPARDTKEVIKKYIEEFSPKFIGLTGEPQSTIVSEGFKVGIRGAPIMPRDVSLSDSKCYHFPIDFELNG